MLFVSASEVRCFPSDFLFGTAFPARQVNGISNDSGHEESIWDNDCQFESDVQCNDMTDDSFHGYIEELQRMRDMNLSSFHFSISWARLMRWNGESKRMVPNPQGIAFYHTILDAVLANRLQPIVTLYHSDLPSMLQTQLEPIGWLNPAIVTHFEAFALLAFTQYGQKVKYWATFNEPLTFISRGYASYNSAFGGIEPSYVNTYTAAHNVLRAHARAVALFRNLKKRDDSVVNISARIGIVLNAAYGYPVDKLSAMDVIAAERKMQFDLGWFVMPLVTGDYPASMREQISERLPRFTAKETEMVKGSYDVLMLTQHNARIVTPCDSERSTIPCDDLPRGYARDRGIDDTRLLNGIHVATASVLKCSWPSDYSEDFLATAKWLHAVDPKVKLLLMENGWCRDDDGIDGTQSRYHLAYVEQMYNAVEKENISIIGYTVRSLLDSHQKLNSQQSYVENASFDRARISSPATNWFAHLSMTKCFDENPYETRLVNMETKHETIATREDLHGSEADVYEKAVAPWSLNAVIFLVVVGLLVLGAITCEAMRELQVSNQGSREEMQVLITIEE